MRANQIVNGRIEILLDKEVYSKDSILKCLYWYSSEFRTGVLISENNFVVVIEPKATGSLTELDLNSTLLKLEQDLLDFNLRDIVTKETKNIRDLLVAKAFSHGQFDEDPPGEISDPVGFDID